MRMGRCPSSAARLLRPSPRPGHALHAACWACCGRMLHANGAESLCARAAGAQVSLLDPVVYPGAIKAFAKEVCKNDLLNHGRQSWFFPDSRLALDLNTDKALKVPPLALPAMQGMPAAQMLPARSQQPSLCPGARLRHRQDP